MSKELNDLKRQADKLTPDEQLSPIAYITQKLQRCEIKTKPRRDIMEFEGIAPNLMGGLDAQEYVKRVRSGDYLEIKEVELRKQE